MVHCTPSVYVQGRSQGGVLWVLKNQKGPPKGPLKCTKRSTTVCLIKGAAYYTDIDLDPVEDLNKFC